MSDTATLTGTITAVTGSNSTQSVITITATQNGSTVATSSATLTGGSGKLTGTYSLSGLPSGDCAIKFTNVNYSTANETIDISLTKANTLDVTLTPKGLQF